MKMWPLWIFLSILIFYLRKSSVWEGMNRVGIQVGDHIYCPVYDLQQQSSGWFDLILLGNHQGQLRIYRIFRGETSVIKLTPVPVMHHLSYLVDGNEERHSYYPGSPFRVRRGELVMFKRERGVFGFSLKEVSRSESWPIKEEINEVVSNDQ